MPGFLGEYWRIQIRKFWPIVAADRSSVGSFFDAELLLKVLSLGSAMIDSIAIIESERVERMTMRNAETSFLLLEEGQKTEALEISTHCGGGAVNAAVAYARLGFDAASIIKLGRDQRADTILNRLTEEGVSTRWAKRDARAPTGASVLVSAHDRNAAIFTFRGANALLEPGDLIDDAFGVDLVHVSSLSNKSANCFPLIIEKAKAAGALIAANPGIRQLSSQSSTFLDLVRHIDILSLNRTEADALVPQLVAKAGEGGPALPLKAGEEAPPIVKRGFNSGGFEMSLPRFLWALRGLGPRLVIVTDGPRGAIVASQHEITFCPVFPSPVAGTAGAGDAFVATFAAFSILGNDAGKCLRLAAINAASVIGHADTQSGLLTRKALEKRLVDTADRLPLRQWRFDGVEGVEKSRRRRNTGMTSRR
jgi:ribokinase